MFIVTTPSPSEATGFFFLLSCNTGLAWAMAVYMHTTVVFSLFCHRSGEIYTVSYRTEGRKGYVYLFELTRECSTVDKAQ